MYGPSSFEVLISYFEQFLSFTPDKSGKETDSKKLSKMLFEPFFDHKAMKQLSFFKMDFLKINAKMIFYFAFQMSFRILSS